MFLLKSLFRLYVFLIIILNFAYAESSKLSGIDCGAVFNADLVDQWTQSSFNSDNIAQDSNLRETRDLLVDMNAASSQPPSNAKFLKIVSSHINLRFQETQIDKPKNTEEFNQKLLDEVISLKNFYHFLFRMDLLDRFGVTDVELNYIVENISPQTIFAINELGGFHLDSSRSATFEENLFRLTRESLSRQTPLNSSQFGETVGTMVRQIKEYPENPQNFLDVSNSFYL